MSKTSASSATPIATFSARGKGRLLTYNVKDYGAIGDGSNDDTSAITAAITALPATGGTVFFPPGVYKVSSTITLSANQRLVGSGIGATTITCAVDTIVIRAGNRQADGVMRNAMYISDMTVNQTNGTQTHSNILVDGGGDGTSICNVITGGGFYGFELMDLDRCYFANIEATNPTNSGIVIEVGLENTYGTVTFLNARAILNANNTNGFLVIANSGQTSPNAPDRLGFINCMMFMTSGKTGCYGFWSKLEITAVSFVSCLFEQNNRQFRCDGSSSSVNFLGCTFLDANNVCTDIAYLNAFGHYSFRDCRMQQSTNAFNGVSGFPIVMLEGTNNNQGNITNLWTGSYSYRGGTDALFGGDTNMVLGSSSQRYANIYTAALAGSGNIELQNSFSMDDGVNLVMGTSIGTKIGTGTTQKIGWWNANPVVQPAAIADASLTILSTMTQLNLALAALRSIGVIST